MDDLPLPAEATYTRANKPGHQTYCHSPAVFTPMRLLLQPGGLSIDLSKPEVVIGRHSGADVRLSLPDISRRHCRFVFADGSWRVLDLNSLNGMFVNGERLHEATVFHGDRVRIGSLTFEVDMGRDAPAPVRKAS